MKHTLLLTMASAALFLSACSPADFSKSSSAADALAISGETSQDCGEGMICLPDGKQIKFTNKIGNPLAVSIASYDDAGFTASFRAPSGRATMLHINYDGTNVTASAMKGWHPQLCMMSSLGMDPCAKMTETADDSAVNCLSAVYWSGDFNGDTTAQSVQCPQ